MRHPRLIEWLLVAAVMLAPTTCTPLVLCVPNDDSDGFFSQGDCALTNRSSFRGHEWITVLGNQDLPAAERFPSREVAEIVEGNRRVDWPKELLVHMAHSVVAYANAATALQDRPENQPLHFLLGPDNDSADATKLAREVIRSRTVLARAAWSEDRVVALTRIGEALHTIQDSFSLAHAVRSPASAERPWCVEQVKAYITRAPGFELPGHLYHGGRSGDTIGHITSLDSIYRSGRDCNDPRTQEAVEGCLGDEARQARLATRDYLALVGALVRDVESDDADVDRALEGFFAVHVALCP
ncbi:MAG: hypothetical protein KF894_25610 [Labilithrix sp.]|nr:hypothetical protein [Labilithrix sp.]